MFSKTPQGCANPDYCMPSTVPSWTNGEDCAAHCPATCGEDEMMCSGGTDDNGQNVFVAVRMMVNRILNF